MNACRVFGRGRFITKTPESVEPTDVENKLDLIKNNDLNNNTFAKSNSALVLQNTTNLIQNAEIKNSFQPFQANQFDDSDDDSCPVCDRPSCILVCTNGGKIFNVHN